MQVATYQADGTGHLVALPNHRHPVTGPLAVGPAGWSHLVVEAPDTVPWKLEVLPLDTAPVLDRKLSGRGPQVVLVPGGWAKVEIRHDDGQSPMFPLDEHLVPGERVCMTPGVYKVPPGPLSVRAAGKWSLRIHG
ncbi:hypothetical protein [Streptomyces sp. NPDC059072]|uniref:hypothetical protein n=1 Tax=unclassified Streptomyces TaxID=2593676 RepID=UPI0036788D1C